MTIKFDEKNVAILTYFGLEVKDEKIYFHGKELTEEQYRKTMRTVSSLNIKFTMPNWLNTKKKEVEMFDLFKYIKHETNAPNNNIIDICYFLTLLVEFKDNSYYEKLEESMNEVYKDKENKIYRMLCCFKNIYPKQQLLF